MKTIIISILAGILLAVVLVYAHGGYFGSGSYGMMGGYGMHEEVEEIFEEGTYTDLENLREEYGMPIMPWIDSEEEFNEFSESFEETHVEFGGCHHW